MLTSLIDVLFPKVCLGCNAMLTDYEQYICTSCRHELPVTNFHLNQDETINKIFYGRAQIEQATALLRFQKKGIVQHLMHNLKYKGYHDIGIFLGEWLGEELKTIPEYQKVDVIIPVPLHPKKMKKRGYNQVEKFAQNLATALEKDYLDDVLMKQTNTSSQVYKNRLERWTSPKEQFVLQNSYKLKSKHILLVDDIITTGATLEACIEVLNSEENHKISIATMAFAS